MPKTDASLRCTFRVFLKAVCAAKKVVSLPSRIMSTHVLHLSICSCQRLGKSARLARYACWISWLLLGIGLSWTPLTTYAQAPAWQTAVVLGTDPAAAFRVVATVAGPAGSFYCLGSFQGTLQLGSTRVTSASEEEDLLVAKYDNVHQRFSWAQQVGSKGEDVAGALVVSGSALYITGSFRDDSLHLGSIALPNAGERDLFVAKLRDEGGSAQVEWAQRAGGPGDDSGRQLALVDSRVYVAGTFEQTATFGNQTVQTAARYSQNCFIAKLLDRGASSQFSWVRSAGGTAHDAPEALAVSGSSVYLAGWTGSSPAAFGSLTLHNTPSRNDSARPDLFLAKLTDSGASAEFVWVQQGSGSEADVSAALVVRGADLYLVGASASPTLQLAGAPVAWLGDALVSHPGLSTTAALVAKFRDEGLTARLVWAYRMAQNPSSTPAAWLCAAPSSIWRALRNLLRRVRGCRVGPRLRRR